jgi:hypothetical protein
MDSVHSGILNHSVARMNVDKMMSRVADVAPQTILERLNLLIPVAPAPGWKPSTLLLDLVVEAYSCWWSDAAAFGVGVSWQSLVVEQGLRFPKLDPVDRLDPVRVFYSAGMPLAAIAAVLFLDTATVSRDKECLPLKDQDRPFVLTLNRRKYLPRISKRQSAGPRREEAPTTGLSGQHVSALLSLLAPAPESDPVEDELSRLKLIVAQLDLAWRDFSAGVLSGGGQPATGRTRALLTEISRLQKGCVGRSSNVAARLGVVL